MEFKPGAGFVIYRNFKDGIRFLGLKGPEKFRISKQGTWDIPKGQLEPGETSWYCAQRETIEEAGIFVIESDKVAGPHRISSCDIYLVTTSEDPVITANPVTGYFEHEDWAWLTGYELENQCYIWLRPFISWARAILNDVEEPGLNNHV
jgi:predicted NUDIX family NTP pyrophosphohydrolase